VRKELELIGNLLHGHLGFSFLVLHPHANRSVTGCYSAARHCGSVLPCGISRAEYYRGKSLVTLVAVARPMGIATTSGVGDGSPPQSNDANPNDIQLPWFALQVRSQYEGKVALCLSGKGYELFLPLYMCRKRWSDRIKDTRAPLFPGYLFCRFDPQNRLPVLTTPWVIQIVGRNRTPVAVDNSEISAVQRLVGSGMNPQPYPFLQLGEKVRIESGPLRELEGILTARRGNHHLVVSITLLQRSVSVVLDPALVSSLRPFRVPSIQQPVCTGVQFTPSVR
jgi:transcription antitermination factor NusG